jgi:hypothetical protein
MESLMLRMRIFRITMLPRDTVVQRSSMMTWAARDKPSMQVFIRVSPKMPASIPLWLPRVII